MDMDIATKVEESEDKKNKRLIIILAIIFIFIVLGLLFVFFLLPKVTNGRAAVIPNCENLKVSSCEKKLQAAGFEVNTKIESVVSSKIDKNRVVKTEPSQGRSVKKGTQITIYKSAGEETVVLEDYLGRNAFEVKTLLETKYELVVTIQKKEPENNDKEYDDDEIIGQSLASGSELKKGDTLVLFTPNVVDSFPDMVEEGWSLSDVEAFGKKYGLTIETIEQETSAYSEGTIIGQSRTKGSTIIKGTTLKVTVAIKPKEKPAPVEEEKPKEEAKEKENTTESESSETNNDNNKKEE